MNIKEMHYDFKMKLNKVDSQQYSNLLIPEIDWLLNEAQEYFIKTIAEPRFHTYHGFEKSQRNIDDIRVLVRSNQCFDVINNIVKLPDDYMFYISSDVECTKGNCANIKCNLKIQQHDDEFENSPFDKSSFEWRHVNGVFTENGIKLYDDGTFKINKICLNYIRKPSYIHNAEDFKPNGYELPGKKLLIGHQDCELPEHTHREIVDLAVAFVTNQLQSPDYQLKLNKLQLNQLM